MTLPYDTVLAAAGLLGGIWLAAGAAIAVVGAARMRRAAAATADAETFRALLACAPAQALVVTQDGRFRVDDPVRAMLAIADTVGDTADLSAAGLLSPDQRGALLAAIAAAAAAGEAFELVVGQEEGGRVVTIAGGPAPAVFAAGSVLLWLTDTTDGAARLEALREERDSLAGARDSLTALIDAAPFPIWYRGPDLRLARVNDAYLRAVEADSVDAVVRSGVELVDEADDDRTRAAAADALGAGTPLSRTVPATLAGERRTLHVVEVPAAGGVAGYAIDVEEREQARAELDRFIRAQRDMLDRLSAGVAQFARDRSLIFSNQPFCRLFALNADFVGDRPEFDRLLDSMRESGNLPEVRDFPEWKEERRGWFTSGLAATEEDWLLPGGKHLRLVAQPLPDGGLLLIFEDRTEQIQLASARDTLLRVRTATFDNLFEAVGVFASDGRLHLWNNRFRLLWQFEEKQLAGHPRIDALVPHIAARLKRPSHAALVREMIRSATVERKQRGGRASLVNGRDFEFAAVPLPDGNALFAMLDITDSKKIEAALRDRNEALEDADRIKTAFVANMSYELRTPLTSIGGFAEMLAAGYAGELPPTAAEYVGAITQSVARLRALIDDVLDLTEGDIGSLVIAEDAIDVAALCAAAAEAAGPAAAARSVTIDTRVDPATAAFVGDERRLRQALANILGFAVSHAAPDGRVRLTAEGDAATVRIVVADDRADVSPAELEQAFDRFPRGGARGTDGAGAAGLGLPLARQFVEAHGGSVAFASNEGAGTSVTLSLPRSR